MQKKARDQHGRCIFIGGGERGYECLQMLLTTKIIPLTVFCMQEDAHEKIRYAGKIATLCKRHAIPVILTKTITDRASYIQIRKLSPDLLIVMGWRTLIPQRILSLSAIGAVAAHESLLPLYRGFAPVNWCVINGEKQTGVTLFYLDGGVDSGDIIAQKKIQISQDESAWELYQKTKKVSIDLIRDFLPAIIEGTSMRKKQNHTLATYTVPRTPDDGHIDWGWDSRRIYNFIRGQSHPYPGAFSFYKGVKVIFQKASLPSDTSIYVGRIPGKIIGLSKGSVDILTGDGTIRIEQIEVEEKYYSPERYLTSIKTKLS